MNIYWTTPTGDDLRIFDVDTQHPRLQTTDRAEGWRDCSPKLYPMCMFGLVIQLLGALNELEMLDNPIVTDSGIRTEEG